MEIREIVLPPGAAGLNIVMIDEAIEELQERLLVLNEQANTIQAKADGEKRDLTEDESKELDKLFVEFEHVESQIERRERINAQTDKLRQSFERKTEPQEISPQNREHDRQPQNQSRKPRSVQVIDRPEDRGKWGWRNFGDFAQGVRAAIRGNVDPRLIMNAPTTFSQESVGADGGYLVPPEFRQAIMEKVLGEESLVSRTDQQVTSGNSLVIPTDETTPWQSSGGVQAYWEGEGNQLTQSKVNLGDTQIRLNKLTALIPVTEELMEDAPALDSYLRRKVPEKFDWKINDSIINGTGVGRPLGILNSATTVSVAKETSQAADTVLPQNIFKMWSRMYGPCRPRSVWLINQDIEVQLFQMTIPIKNVAGTENVGGSVVYLPANGLSSSPFGTLMGRPVIPMQACQTLGDKGDIMLVDLQQYLTATKAGGIRTDVSMHLYFDYDMQAFRFILRFAGQPWWKSAITPANSSASLSCFVTLDERS